MYSASLWEDAVILVFKFNIWKISDLDIVRVHLRPIEETTESPRVVNDSSDDIVKKPNNECYNVTLTRDM